MKGVGAKDNIPANTIIMSIPNKILISVKKALKSDLKDMYKAHPLIFDESKNHDAEFNILAVFVIYEKLKNENSFYFPYLNSID